MRADDLHRKVETMRAAAAPPPNEFQQGEVVSLKDPRLNKLADVAEGAIPYDPIVEYGPLIHRAAAIASNAIAAVCNEAAEQVMKAADAMMQEAVTAMSQANETAQTLRQMGQREGLMIGKTAELARGSFMHFREEKERIVNFQRELVSIRVAAMEAEAAE